MMTTHLRFWRASLALILAAIPALCAEPGASDAGLIDRLRAPGGPAGLCAVLDCGGELAEALARSERLAVHGLESSPVRLALTRTRLDAAGLAGRTAIEPWTEKRLPYADNLINVVVAGESCGATAEELLRVTAPLGLVCSLQNGRWQITQKPWPAALDGWTHARHGADGNMVSRDRDVATPAGIRWIAGPAQDAGGRKWYYDHVLVSDAGRNFYAYESNIVARDAFNGRLLWDRPAVGSVFKETGVRFGVKTAVRTSKVRPVAANSRLYAVANGRLEALDAPTGRALLDFGPAPGARELAVLDGALLFSDSNSLRAFSLDGPLRWSFPEAPRRFVAAEGRVLCLQRSNVVCLRLSDGAVQWRAEETNALDASTCTLYNGVLILELSSWHDDGLGSGVTAYDAQSGRRLWSRDYIPGLTHFKEARSFFAQDLVWLEAQTQVKPSKTVWTGLDPRTGEPRKEWGARGLHCATPVATERCLIAPEMEFTDIDTGRQSRARMAKSACRLPFVPANGLLNTFPVQCECYPMLRGYMGLAPASSARPINPPRLQRGPAAPVSAPSAPSTGDWPLYRRDAWRSSSSPAAVPEGPLAVLWQTQLPSAVAPAPLADWADDPFVRGVITPPVCASGVLLAALPHQHQVVALDPDTGARRWTFTAGGRVDTAPSIAGGLALFGAHDGWVYAVSLADGQLAWRYRAAPAEARIAAYGQIESPWPVAGSVLVDEGVAYCAAGRHPASDKGLRVAALRVTDGGVLWEKTITDMGVRNWYSAFLPQTRQKVGLDFEPVDLFCRDGGRIAMSRWQFEPRGGKITLAFSSTNLSVFDGLAVPRGVWGYGIRQTKQVLPRPEAAFHAGGLVFGTTNDTAILLAAGAPVTVDRQGVLHAGERAVALPAPTVHDGLILARGRLFASTRQGAIVCVGPARASP